MYSFIIRSRDLSSLGGETDQNIPDNDTVFDVEQMQCEDDNGEEGESDVGKIYPFLLRNANSQPQTFQNTRTKTRILRPSKSRVVIIKQVRKLKELQQRLCLHCHQNGQCKSYQTAAVFCSLIMATK